MDYRGLLGVREVGCGGLLGYMAFLEAITSLARNTRTYVPFDR